MLRKYYEIRSDYFDEEDEGYKRYVARLSSLEEAEKALIEILENKYRYSNIEDVLKNEDLHGYQIRPYYVYEPEKEEVK